MNLRVSRSCIQIGDDGETKPSQPLADHRASGAYVLLGEPGAGKTTAFEQEAEAVDGVEISARDFVVLAPQPEWQGKTLFIDGLDEMRAGTTDGLTPLDAIRQKLDHLGRPPFRLSCREADWLGASDREKLERVAPDGRIAVLHLDDLSDEQIALLLKQNHGIADPQAFLEAAREKRLDALLGNPQTLRMLAKAVGQGWPDSLTATYDLACRKLAEETNTDHRHALRHQTVATDDLLISAGHVCAVQMLAGIAGFALDNDAADASHPTFSAIGLSVTNALDQALGSRLFEAHAREERREPIHRSIAEYLGARFLARKIETDKLPLGRVLALMVADDGGIVSDLRGLHAWLAVHCLSARDVLIAQDPLGVILYGDIRGFGVDGKRKLLDALRREAKRYPWFRSQDWHAPPFGALADHDTAAYFREILTATDRDEAHQSLVDCVLEAVTHGEPLPGLGDPLLTLVRDSSHWPVNRKLAITAYIHATGGAPEPLTALLEDIDAGRVADGDDELTGMVLRHLYPAHISGAQVIRYLHPAKNKSLIGSYLLFWEHDLAEKTATADLPILLDGIAQNIQGLRFASDDFHFNRFAGHLLVRGIEAAGATASIERLWNWLGIGLDEHAYCRLEKEDTEQIAGWLASRPDTYQALMQYAIRQCDNQDDLHCIFRAEHRFHNAEPPPGMEDWYFAQAQLASGENMRRYLFNKGAIALFRRQGATPEFVETLNEIAERYPTLESLVQSWLVSELEDWRRDDAQRKVQRSQERQTRIEDWRDLFRNHYAAIQNGTAFPKIMHDLALIYFGRYREAEGDTPIERLQSFFGIDADLTLTTLAGLRRTLERDDLPSLAEIIDLAVNGRHHYIAEACLAGAEELFRIDADALPALDGNVQERLVAFRLTHDFGNTPPWFLSLVAHRPEAVAEVLVAYGAAMFKARKEHVSGLYALAHDDAYREVARRATVCLLSAYPLRSKKERLGDLGTLLAAAIRHVESSAVLGEIERKLALKIDKPQRCYWLAAGLLLGPTKYERLLAEHVGQSQLLALVVAGFFDSRPGNKPQMPELSESAIALLIRLLAPHVVPERTMGAHRVTREMNAADLVRSLISRLGASPTATAVATFDALLEIESLRPWHGELRHRRESQRVVRREARFRRASATAVVQTLENGGPASAADLKALATAHLREISYRLRHGSSNGYRAFWNEENRRLTTPKPENECRDRLLDHLEHRMVPLGVDAQKEGQFAEGKRADIRLSYPAGKFVVPIEIKQDYHRDLWSAMRKQLLAKYVPDPDAAGQGIYLVFWFDSPKMVAPIDGGKRPRSAEELEMRLRLFLDSDEQHGIEVIVIDCARPAPA